MTPFMPEKFVQDGRPESARSDVEMKNALAVKTVKSAGVTRINDLYSVVTQKCGNKYRNCSICDDESQYHGMNSSLPCDPPVQVRLSLSLSVSVSLCLSLPLSASLFLCLSLSL